MSRKATPLNIVKWKVEYLIYRLVEFFLSSLSLATVYKIGAFLGRIVYLISPRYRGIVKRNLMMTLGESSLIIPPQAMVEEVFEKNGGNLLTTLAAGKKEIKDLDQHLELSGLEALDEALESSGVIVMLAHMGNWEILTKLTDKLRDQPDLGALYRPLNNPYMNTLILDRREGSGMQLISSRKPAFTILELLNKKGVMCILSDQKIGAKGNLASFFGKITPCTRLPLMMKEKSKAALFTLSMKSLEPGKWALIVKPVLDPSQQGAMDALSLSMRDSLVDCFWFQDRWQEFPHPRVFKHSNALQSAHFKSKPLPGIVESRELLLLYPELQSLLPDHGYPIHFWDEGANPEECYFAIGESSAFTKACHRVGLKKGCVTPKGALTLLQRPSA